MKSCDGANGNCVLGFPETIKACQGVGGGRMRLGYSIVKRFRCDSCGHGGARGSLHVHEAQNRDGAWQQVSMLGNSVNVDRPCCIGC